MESSIKRTDRDENTQELIIRKYMQDIIKGMKNNRATVQVELVQDW